MEAGSDTKAAIAAYLKKEFELDGNDITEMFDEYFNNMDSLIAKSSEQAAQNDFEQLARSGHSIKGASANIGAVVISALGKQLEFAAKDKNIEKTLAAISDLKYNVDCLKKS